MAGQSDIGEKVDRIRGFIEMSDSGTLFASAESEQLQGARWNSKLGGVFVKLLD